MGKWMLSDLREWVEDQLGKPGNLSTTQYNDLVAQLIQIEQAEHLEDLETTIARLMQEQLVHLDRIAASLELAAKRMEA